MAKFRPHITINAPAQTRAIIRGEESKHWYWGWRQAEITKLELEKAVASHIDAEAEMLERKAEIEEKLSDTTLSVRSRNKLQRELNQIHRAESQTPTPCEMIQRELDVVLEEMQRIEAQYADEIAEAAKDPLAIEAEADDAKKIFAASADFIAISTGIPKGSVEMLLTASDTSREKIITGMFQAHQLVHQSLRIGSKSAPMPDFSPKMLQRIQEADIEDAKAARQQQQIAQPFVNNGGR